MDETEAQAQWQSNLAAALPIVSAALQAVTGTEQAVVYQPPSFWDQYGPWLVAGGGALLLVLLLRK